MDNYGKLCCVVALLTFVVYAALALRETHRRREDLEVSVAILQDQLECARYDCRKALRRISALRAELGAIRATQLDAAVSQALGPSKNAGC